MNGKYHFRALNSVVQFSVFNLENLTDKHYTKTVEASSVKTCGIKHTLTF